MNKVYHDSVNNKEVIDITGMKTEAAVKAEYGLDVSTQVLPIDVDNGMAHEVVGGVLTEFDLDARRASDASARETARQTAENNTKTTLGLSQAEFDDLKRSLGL